ncbi:unnamed protein product [Schistocephalus solidus]|nr:unnamed protein product [Schistocephalus solidus]
MLRLPRFQLAGSESKDLKEVLSAMGMPSAFSSASADFSGITGRRDLCVGNVFHKATIMVDEDGAEAAAATASVMMLRCAPMPVPKFFVDHPFLLFIVSESGLPVFMGHVIKPETK